MARIRCGLEVFLVTTHASRGVQRVVVVDVAIGACPGRYGVHSRKREVCEVMVERRVRPVAGVVALVASLREIRGDVIGIRGALKILKVTSHASCGAQGVIAVDVAIGALARRHGMHSGQREAGRGMIKLSISPLHDVVALLAGCRKAAVGHRSSRTGKVFLVARKTCRAAQVVIVIDVAICALAGRIRMPTGQKESGCTVVKLGVEPVVRGVARFASGRELRADVIRIGRARIVRLMAREARGRHRLEFAIGAAFVAGIAVNGSVGAGQREPIIVLLHVLDRDLPSPYRVALFAVRAQLALVNVGVTILAALTDIRENHFHVTRGASHGSVHATQRIARLIMIEFRNSADWLPATRGVAVLAGNSQVSVGTMSAVGSLCSRASREQGKR